jgi:SNF2 family DNA or RNA helicase
MNGTINNKALRYNIDRILKGTIKSTDEQLPTPDRFKRSLKPHQGAILHAARMMEIDQHEIFAHPQFAILSDPMGSGKTTEALSIICSDTTLGIYDYTSEYGVSGMFQVYSKNIFIPINIIVCPSSILLQWEEAVEELTDLSVYVIPSTRHVKIFMERCINADNNFPEIVIVNASAYQDLSIALSGYRIARLFVDEVDKIDVPLHSSFIVSRFMYYITASVNNLVKLDMNPNIFLSIMSNLQHIPDLIHLFLRAEQSFIDEGMEIIPPNHYIKKFIMKSHELVSRFADDEIVELLMADNYEKASNILKIDLVPWVISKYQSQIELSTDENEKQELYTSITRLNTLIEEESRCAVCFEEVIVTAIPPCKCMQKYCHTCLNKWIDNTASCPTCRKPISKSTITYHHSIDKNELDITAYNNPMDVISNSISKLATIKNFIKFCIHERKIKNIRRRILIFSTKNSFKELTKIMNMLEVPYQTLNGNVYKIANTVKQFKNDNLMFILANPNNFGRGLNLQECTDMFIYHTSLDIKQVYSRAQRYGRVDALNVYHLLYPQEYEEFNTTMTDIKYVEI